MCMQKAVYMYFPAVDHEYVWSGTRGGDETDYESFAGAQRFRVVHL